MQDAGIRNQHGALSAAFGQALRWGWVSQNVVAMAQRKTSKKQPRGVMSLDDVRSAIADAAEFDPAAALALRVCQRSTSAIDSCAIGVLAILSFMIDRTRLC